MEIKEILVTVSVLEILGFFLNMIFFIGGSSYQLWFGVMNMFHVIRGFLGFILSRIFPASHEIISKLEYFGTKQLIFAQVKPELTSKVQSLLLKYYEDYG